jgi:acetyl-CoA carboxylase carboxyltransferase component
VTAATEPERLTAQGRIGALLDGGIFIETGKLMRSIDASGEPSDPDAVITGWGHVAGRKVFVYAHDPTASHGAVGAAVGTKVAQVAELAMKAGAPLVGLIDSHGVRITEGVGALAGYGEILDALTRCSGVIPQIAAVMGPCVGLATYAAGLADLTFMVGGSSIMFMTSPGVIAAVTAEDVDPEDLGGAMSHAARSGVAHFLAEDDGDCIEQIRYALSFLSSNCLDSPPRYEPDDAPDRDCPELEDLIPAEPNRPYDMNDVITSIADGGEFFEVQRYWARNLLCGFARMNGSSVGIVASQPQVLAGTLDIDASCKGARFVRLCDAFNIPLIAILDVPGFLPGIEQEYGGIIRHGAELLYAFTEATVPRITLITRKAYGGAYLVMNSKHIRSDVNFAWPLAEIAVMGAEGAVNVIYRREIAGADDPNGLRAELSGDYAARFSSPYLAAERGYVDAVIRPAETRRRLIRSLDMLATKRETMTDRKHDNMPL